MLGSLARWLRMAGFDAAYAPEGDDREVARLAVAQTRVLLTRDGSLAASTPGAMLIRSTDLDVQLGQVLAAYPVDESRMMTLCSECNGALVPADKASLAGAVPEGALERNDEFWLCSECGKAYWKGSHWPGITARLRSASATSRPQGP